MMWTIVAEGTHPSPVTRDAGDGLMLHEKVNPMPGLPMGPFVRRGDGAIVAVDDACVLISRDEGASWHELAKHPFGDGVTVRPERMLLATSNGTIILAYVNEHDRHWTWSDELRDAPGARMPTYAARSLDGGATWVDNQQLHVEWTGAIRDMIQLRSGRVVFTSMKMLSHPGRHVVLTYASDDEGQNWLPSNLIDYGGNGHHDGAIESTIVELKDGRLWKYLRTNWGQFWVAESCNGGRSWESLGPAGVDASSAPGLLFRLQSGRIMLLWNRLYPEGQHSFTLRGGDRLWSATPVSNHREELAVAFSEDECASWSAPVIIARKKDAWLSYPYAFEAEPGVVWITTMQGDVRARLCEADFV